jgi:hypothetical protein
MNRTGTKWVSNTLCTHDDVIGAQSERARGILETNMFGAMQDKFDLSNPDEYIGFVELWAKTELFQQTGVDKEMFYKLQPRPRTMLQMFGFLMREFAQGQKKTHWLQKTSPLKAATALDYFDNALVVIVRRNMLDTLKSTWAMHMRHRRRKILRTTYAYVRDRKIMDAIAKSRKVVQVHYEVLRDQTQSEINRLCHELGLDPGKISAQSPFRKNTSFESEKQRESIMSREEAYIARFAAALFNLIPLGVMQASSAIKARLFGRKRIALMSGTFGVLFDELADQSRDVS